MNGETCSTTTPRDRRNSARYTRLMALWALVYVACTYAVSAGYAEALPLMWLAILLPSAFAALAAHAYWRYMNGLDELLRAIELRALALALSAGFVVWPAMELIELGVADVKVPVTLLVITASYVYGLMKGRLAHQ